MNLPSVQRTLDVVALGEALIEFNQTHPHPPNYLQGFGGDTSNAVVAAARAGARCAYLTLLGDNLAQATRWANAATALSVQGMGAIAPMPHAEQVRAWLENA